MPKRKKRGDKPIINADEDDEPAAGKGDELPWGSDPDAVDDENDGKAVPWDIDGADDNEIDDVLDEEQDRILLDHAASVPCPVCGGEFEGHKTRTGNLFVRCLSCEYECDV